MLVQNLIWITLLLFLSQHGAEAKKRIGCEGTSVFLRCEWGYIKVQKANYGRTDSKTCASGVPADQLSNTDCKTAATLSIMSDRCDGTRSCFIRAENSVFSDPCVGISKYLDVIYGCHKYSGDIV